MQPKLKNLPVFWTKRMKKELLVSKPAWPNFQSESVLTIDWGNKIYQQSPNLK